MGGINRHVLRFQRKRRSSHFSERDQQFARSRKHKPRQKEIADIVLLIDYSISIKASKKLKFQEYNIQNYFQDYISFSTFENASSSILIDIH